MTYRDELEAAHARVAALEQQLAETQEQVQMLEADQSTALVPAGSTALARAGSGGKSAARWLGAPTQLELSHTLEGSVSENAHAELVETLRVQTNNVGMTSVLQGSFAWTSTGPNNGIGPFLSASVTSHGGRTVIRLNQKLGNLVGGIFGGVGGGVGGGGLIVPIATGLLSPLLPILALPLWLGATYIACRKLYRSRCTLHAEKLEKLLDALVAVAEKHVETDE